MKIERFEGIGQNPLFLALLLCTVLSPVMPGVCLAFLAFYAWKKFRWELFEADLVSLALLGLASVALIATLIQQTWLGFVSILFLLIYFAVYGWMKKSVNVTQFQSGLSMMSVVGVGIVAVMVIDRLGGFEFLPTSLAYFFGLESWKPTDSIRSTGTSGNANLAAGLLVCLALVCFYKVIAVTSALKQRLFWAGLFALYMLGFGLTGSRMAWIALSFGIAVQLWFVFAPRIGRHLRQLHFSHVFVFFAVSGLLLLMNKEWLPREATFNTDLFLRLQIWERSLDIFHHNWLFGVLPLHYGEVFLQQFGQYEFHAHNLFIGIAVDYGIIGFILFNMLLVSSLIRGIQWIRWADSSREQELAIVLMSLIFAFIGQGLADYTILVPQTGWLFLMSLGFIHIRWMQLAPVKQLKAVRRKMPHSPHIVH